MLSTEIFINNLHMLVQVACENATGRNPAKLILFQYEKPIII